MATSEEIVYRPDQRRQIGFFRTLAVLVRNLIVQRELVWQLFRRDFLASYKKSFIGLTWIFISPILGIVSWVFLQQTGMLKPGDLGIPYPAYVLIGSTMWGLFVGFYTAAADMLTGSKELLQLVKFPHEVLLFKQVAQQLANFLVSFILALAVLAAFGIWPSWQILLFPLVALPMLFLGAAIGLVISMLAVVAVDIHKMVGLLIQLLMWATPVIYSSEVESPLVRALIRWNPLTYLVCSARDIVIYGRLYEPGTYALCAAASLVAFLIAWRVFYISEDRVIERHI